LPRDREGKSSVDIDQLLKKKVGASKKGQLGTDGGKPLNIELQVMILHRRQERKAGLSNSKSPREKKGDENRET